MTTRIKSSRKRKTIKLRTNGKHKIDAASTIKAPIPYALQRILRPQAQYRWLYPQLAAITPQYIETTLNGAMAGYNVQQWWLFDLMLKTWPELLACYTELVQGVMRKKIMFEPYCEEDEKPSDSAQERSKLVSTALRRMQPDAERDDSTLEGTVEDLLDGWFRGVTCSEVIWQMIDGPDIGTIAAPKATFWVDPSNYAFDVNGTLGLRPDKGKYNQGSGTYPFQTTSAQPQPSQLLAFPEHKFLIAMHKSSAGNVLGGPLLRPLAWWWCAANFSSDWLLNLAQVFGLPFRWANYDANAPQATVDAICNMLQNMGSAGWAAFPIPTTLEMVTPSSAQGSDHSPQGELLDRADRYARLLILGQTMTGTHGTLGKGGGQAFGEVEKTVKDDRIEAAGKFATDIINQQLVPSILMLNYGDVEEMPTMRFLEDKEAGLNEAQRDKTLADAGLEIGVDYLRKKYDIPEPAEGEDTIGGEKPMPDFGGFGQDFGGSPDGTGADTTGEPPDVKAGDLPGHEFHGNQYTHGDKKFDTAWKDIHDEARKAARSVYRSRDVTMRPPKEIVGPGQPYSESRRQWDLAYNDELEKIEKERVKYKPTQVGFLKIESSDQTGHPFRGNQYVKNPSWTFEDAKQIGAVTHAKPGLWRKTPGDFTAASQAAAHYAKQQKISMQIVPGNSYGHKVYNIFRFDEDGIGKSGLIGDQHNIAIVHPDGKVFQVKAIRKTKIPHDTSNFPSLLQSEENKRRAQLNAKLLELNEIEDDAVFSRELLALTEEIK